MCDPTTKFEAHMYGRFEKVRKYWYIINVQNNKRQDLKPMKYEPTTSLPSAVKANLINHINQRRVGPRSSRSTVGAVSEGPVLSVNVGLGLGLKEY